MKILFVSSGNSSFGISPIVYKQGQSLECKGFTIKYFTIKGHGLKGYLKNVTKLKKTLKQESHDIIHAHYGLSAIVAYLSKGETPLVVSFMGSDLIGSSSKNIWLILICKGSILVNKFLTKHGYNHVIIKSKWMLDKIANSEKISLIPNGIEINSFNSLSKDVARKAIGLSSDEKVIIFVSDPERPEKNYSLAQEAVNRCRLKPKLIPVYNIQQDQLKYYYSAADLLLMTSMHEGSPNVIKEAMASNCPIVSTDVGDVEWLFGETKGHYLTSYDPKNIAESIELAFEFRKKYGQTMGRERIIELGLDSETVAEKIIEVYKKVLMIDDCKSQISHHQSHINNQ